MAIEDAGFLGRLFSKITSKEQIPLVLKLCHEHRRVRVEDLRLKADVLGQLFELRDGPSQELRDSQFRDLGAAEQHPGWYGNPDLQRALFSYDTVESADQVWNSKSEAAAALLISGRRQSKRKLADELSCGQDGARAPKRLSMI